MSAESTSVPIGQEANLCLMVKLRNRINLRRNSPKIAPIRTKFSPNLHQISQFNQNKKQPPVPWANFLRGPTLKISLSKSSSSPQRLILNSTKLCAILIQISLLLPSPPPPPSQFHLNPCKSGTVVEAAPGQYVASFLSSPPDDLDVNEEVGPAHSTTAVATNNRQHLDEEPGKQSRNLIEYLQSLPITSVGQKHRALIECNPIEEMKRNSKFKLVWLKLVRNNNTAKSLEAADQNDITLLSVGQRLVSPDKRFRVQHQPPSKWTLTIDNVNQSDDKTYFLCQAAGSQTKGTSFLGGAQLNVLAPPKVVELETSPSLVQVDEFGQLRLQCKVISEPQAQMSWRREDGQSLDGFEQRFRHHIERRPSSHQMVSIDSGELLTNAIRRDQAGAYLCIASNGVQPGVSQRISVVVVNCRQSVELEAKSEPCGQLELTNEITEIKTTTTTTTTTSTTKRPHQLLQSSSGWSTLARQRAASGRANASTVNSSNFEHQQMKLGNQQQQQQQPDKSRGSRYNHNQQRRRGPNQTIRERRPVHAESDCSSPLSSLASCSMGNWQLLLALLGLVWSLLTVL